MAHDLAPTLTPSLTQRERGPIYPLSLRKRAGVRACRLRPSSRGEDRVEVPLP